MNSHGWLRCCRFARETCATWQSDHEKPCTLSQIRNQVILRAKRGLRKRSEACPHWRCIKEKHIDTKVDPFHNVPKRLVTEMTSSSSFYTTRGGRCLASNGVQDRVQTLAGLADRRSHRPLLASRRLNGFWCRSAGPTRRLTEPLLVRPKRDALLTREMGRARGGKGMLVRLWG